MNAISLLVVVLLAVAVFVVMLAVESLCVRKEKHIEGRITKEEHNKMFVARRSYRCNERGSVELFFGILLSIIVGYGWFMLHVASLYR